MHSGPPGTQRIGLDCEREFRNVLRQHNCSIWRKNIRWTIITIIILLHIYPTDIFWLSQKRYHINHLTRTTSLNLQPTTKVYFRSFLSTSPKIFSQKQCHEILTELSAVKAWASPVLPGVCPHDPLFHVIQRESIRPGARVHVLEDHVPTVATHRRAFDAGKRGVPVGPEQSAVDIETFLDEYIRLANS